MSGSPLNISSIRIVSSSIHYDESLISAITVFDSCISGGTSIPNCDSSKNYGKIISKLMEVQLTGINDGIDEYIVKTLVRTMIFMLQNIFFK